MADENLQAQAELEGFTNSVNAGSSALEKYKAMVSEAASSLIGGVGAVRQWTSALMNANDLSKTAAASSSMLAASVLGVSKAFAGFDSSTYGSGFQSIKDQIVTSIDPIAKMTGGLGMLAKALGIQAPPGIALTADYIKTAVAAIGTNITAAQSFQNAYLGMALSSGKAGELFNQAGNDLSKLNGVLKNQVDAITGVSSSTGIAFPKINDFYMALGKIPGALQATTAATGGSTGSVQAWQAAIDIATAGGMDLKSAIDQQKTAYDQFGETGDKALEFMGRQIELSQNLGLPIEKTTGYIDKMASAFQYLGDNTKGTSVIFQDMFARLRDSGVGVEPAISLVDQMTTSMTNMSVAQKAFLSSRSGGPGGLMGAAQIEKELKKDKSADVMDKMRKALMQQFGGHVVTLDDASKSQQAAAQFQRERALLQSGAFGIGKGATDEQATDLLAALSKPQTAATAKDSTSLLQSLRDQGKTVADQNRTMFSKMGTDVESIKAKGGLELLAAVKAGLGVSNERIKAMMDMDRSEGATTANTAKTATEAGQDVSDTTTSRNLQGIKNMAMDALSHFGETASIIRNQISGPPDAADQAQAQSNMRNQLLAQRNAESTQTVPIAAAAIGDFSHASTTAQHMHNAVMNATANASGKAGTTSASTTSTQPRATPSSSKQPIIVNANIYVDGKLVQKSQSHQVAQDLGNHQSNPGN